jgi:NAD(P)-dependent dehydrogenase (short-subunit alcohol dehydrogenase family)
MTGTTTGSAGGSLAGKVAVITGGASGIGYAVGQVFRREGAEVVIADVEAGALERAAADLGALGVVVDVSSRADVERLAAEVIERHGKVDLVVNNAGVARIAPFTELTEADFRWVLDVNLWGVIHGMQVFLPFLESTSEDGYMLNTASIAGLRNGPGLAAYTASKFAVVSMTETLEQELRARSSTVDVGVLLPAMVRTNIGASERNRPGAAVAAGEARALPDRPDVLSAESVAEMVLAGVLRRDLYLITHPETLDSVRERHRRIEAAFEHTQK